MLGDYASIFGSNEHKVRRYPTLTVLIVTNPNV